MTLVIAERVGKAIRSPAKHTLLSFATASVGRGRGFAVHDALDSIGGIIGPLVVASMLALTGGRYGPALGVLGALGVAVLALLIWLRLRVPKPAVYKPIPASPTVQATAAPLSDTRWWAAMPRDFWLYATFTAITMAGFATFGVLSFHMVARGILPAAAVP